MVRNKFLAFFLSALLLIAITGCGSDDKKAEEKPRLVKTQTVTISDANSEGSYPGVVKGRYETNMSFQIGGRIVQRYVQAGDAVHAGDVLMTIDDRDVRQQSNQGDAQVAAAKAQLDLSSVNLKRYQSLYAQDAVPASVLDQYQTAYDAALAAYNQAASGAAQGHNALGYASLIAASDGIIANVQAEAGQVVAAGQTVLTLVQPQELEVEINLPENRIGGITSGQKAAITFWSLNNQTTEGIIREISPMADNVARTYKIRISLPQPPSGLHLGMTANASIKSVNTVQKDTDEQADFVILPLSAIYQTEDTAKVWVVNTENMTVYLQPVQVEDFANNKLKVRGLNNGDIVVVAGVHKLSENMQIRLAEDAQ